MKVFTYNDYIKCIHTLRLNAVFQLAEEGEKYNLETEKQKNRTNNNIYDELIKKFLGNRNQVANIINDFIENKEKIEGQDLIKYTNSFITRKYKSRETDVVYMLKDKYIFFLIEHQTSIDNNMEYRMLNYCVDIIYDWNVSTKMKKGIKYPIVVPIVIYTGTNKWNITNNFDDLQVSDYIFQNYKIDFKYNLIEINKLSSKFLIQKNTLFSQVMALQKTKNYKEFKKILYEILIKNKENFNKKLYDISALILENLIKNSCSQKFLQEIHFKVEGGKNNMHSLYERQLQGFKEDIETWINGFTKKIKNETIVEITKKLINNNSSEKFIIEVTGITKSELQEIKNQLLENKQIY